MPLVAAVLIVAIAVLGVVAILAGLVVAARGFPHRRRRPAVAAVLVVAGVGVLIVGEAAPRAYAAGLPSQNQCIPTDAVIELDTTPIAWQAGRGELRGTATLDAAGVEAAVAEALVDTPLADGDPRVEFVGGEVSLDVDLDVSVLTVPLAATVEPQVDDGALVFHPSAFSVVGFDAPEWAVDLVDRQLQDADSWLSEALAPDDDDPCAGTGTQTVRLSDLRVDDVVRVRFAVPVR